MLHSSRYVAQEGQKRSSLYNAKMNVYWLNVHAGRPLHGRKPRAPPFLFYSDGHRYNPDRFMCIARFPWFDRLHDIVEEGLRCKGCDRLPQWTHRSARYSLQDFLIHVRECPKSLETLQALEKRKRQMTISAQDESKEAPDSRIVARIGLDAY